MRALLICPYECTVTEVQIDNGNLASYYEALSYPGHKVDTFDVVRCDGFDIFVDDEGLLKDSNEFFSVDGYPQPLAGRGLVTGGVDREGETLACTMSIEELAKRVHWIAFA